MADTRKVVLFFDGTITTKNDKPDNILGSLVSSLLHRKHSILKLFENCEEENKYHFDGPGTDIFNTKVPGLTVGKVIGTIGGCIDGHFGMNGIKNTLTEVLNLLDTQYQEAKKENKVLELHVYSWSRGGLLTLRLKKELAALIVQNKIEVNKMVLFNFDPVAGSFIDRAYLYRHGSQKDPDIPIFSNTYYSHSGNLELWDKVGLKFFNTPFFSGLDIDEENPNSQQWLVNANHEGIVGKLHDTKESNPQMLAGKIVLGHVVENSTINFNEGWKDEVIKEGKNALATSIKLNLTPKQNRSYVSPKSIRHCFIGQKGLLRPITDLAARYDQEVDETTITNSR